MRLRMHVGETRFLNPISVPSMGLMSMQIMSFCHQDVLYGA